MKDVDSRLAGDLSLAVVRLARQLLFRRPQSPVSLSQPSAVWLQRQLATLDSDERATLLRAADLMTTLVDESA